MWKVVLLMLALEECLDDLIGEGARPPMLDCPACEGQPELASHVGCALLEAFDRVATRYDRSPADEHAVAASADACVHQRRATDRA